MLHRSTSDTFPLDTKPVDHVRAAIETEQVHGLSAQECLVGVRTAFRDRQQVIKETRPLVSA